jgi:hypothetical protein
VLVLGPRVPGIEQSLKIALILQPGRLSFPVVKSINLADTPRGGALTHGTLNPKPEMLSFLFYIMLAQREREREGEREQTKRDGALDVVEWGGGQQGSLLGRRREVLITVM